MIPIKLQLHNFLSYREPQPIDFQSFNLAVLSGNNGVGKSSILEAITWAIWGQTRAGSDDDLIHQGTSECWVEFVFEHEGSLYRIVRRREIKKRTAQSLLEFQTKSNKKTLIDNLGWQSLAESTLKATQEKIINILGVPYEIFVNSSYLRQGHADEFTIKTPAERKEILSEILGLSYYEELSLKAREKTRQQEEKIKLFAFQLDDLRMQIARKKDVEEQFIKYQKQFASEAEKLRLLQETIKKLEKQSQYYEIISEKLNLLRQEFANLQKEAQFLNLEEKKYSQEKKRYFDQLKNKEKINNDYQRFLRLEKDDEQENEKFRRYSEFLQELKGLEQLENKLKDDIGRIKKISTCPMCRRPMKDGEAQDIAKHLQKEFNSSYSAELKELQKEIRQLNYQYTRHEKIKTQIKNLEGIREQKQILDLAENNLENIKKNLLGTQIRSSILKKRAQKITQDGQKLRKELPSLEKANLLCQEKKRQEEILDNRILELQNILGGLKQELNQIEKQEEELKNLEKIQIQTQREAQNFQDLALAFGKKGIQAMIIEQSLTIIEAGANDLLGKITDGRMSLKFITQKAKKAPAGEEDLIETLEIKIADEIGQRDYEMFSGGEAFRINFAIRIALSKLLASRSGTHLRFLAIDEGFGMLDVAGRDDLVAAINSIAPDFEKILVITHFQELKDLFPTKIEVTKNEQGSQIELVS